MAAPRNRHPAARRPSRGAAARRPAPPPRHPWRAVGRWLVRVLAYGAVFVVGVWLGLLTAAIPHLDELERQAEQRQLPGAIVASDGKTVLRRLRAPQTHTYVDEGDIPSLLANAVIAAEDRRFYEHSGIDVRGIARAGLADLRVRATVEGGSTITQQLVKNAYVGPRQTLARKSREAVFAVALESRWSKSRILTAYLNSAYFGNGLYGIADAAQGYFGVPVARLRPAQAALLAGLLRSPEGNNPVSAPDNARAARARVLDAMNELGTLSPMLARASSTAALPSAQQLRRLRTGSTREIAPQLADAVVGDLIERYGVQRALGGGLRVRTTIDADMQRVGRDAVRRAADVGLDAALVAIDPHTGEVRAMVNGGRAARTAFNVALHGQRQPGSAFKPFMLAAAFEAGLAPDSPVMSAPFDKTYAGQRFRVSNGGGYSGRTTLERATWQSDNTVYARLQDRFGIESAIDVARAAGIRSRMDAVPALVLGALPQGTTPTELAHAYATFAEHGTRISMVSTGGPRYIARVGEGGGHTWRPRAVRRSVVDRGVADLVTQVLQGVVRSGTGTRASIGRPAAGKTGTTEEYRDAWFVGYTPDLVTAVWVGHAEGGIAMRTQNAGGPVTGGSIPASIWHDFMVRAVAETPVHDFRLRKPRYVTVDIDEASGLLAGPWCAGSVPARFIAGKEPTQTATSCTARTRPIPDLRRMSLDDARAELARQGFDNSVRIEHELVAEAQQDGRVLRHSPAPGAQVGRQDAITLVIGDYPFRD